MLYVISTSLAGNDVVVLVVVLTLLRSVVLLSTLTAVSILFTILKSRYPTSESF